jgi:D-beta-D-heptose 7-phosphate kinase/D-beta-D-heptose 1-phosphate adenosyltransferase
MDFASLNNQTPTVLVLGDIFIDHSFYGTVTKVANESPTPVLNTTNESITLGGAGNVIMNLKALGTNVISLCPVGTNGASKKVREMLYASHVQDYGLEDNTYPTPIKYRGFAGKKHLFRYDIEPTHTHHNLIYQETLTLLESILSYTTVDAIICSDYNKGLFRYEFAQKVIQIANKYNIPTIVDPKGNFTKYKDCTFLKPNYAESQKATGADNISSNISMLKELINPKYTCITMAEEGMRICDNTTGKIYSASTQKMEVNDVTGAGDVVTAVAAYCLANKLSIEFLATAATFLATQSVQHVGTYVIQQTDIWELYKRTNPTKIITDISTFNLIPRNKKKIVFTNGCFDLLHVGHIQSLQYAKSLGDILVVAINSDESIHKLKGPMRPIIPLEQRMKMLEALACVDYIIPFHESSPTHLAQRIQPDVYVKGEEYKNHIFQVQSNIHLNPMIPDVSTSKIIDKIVNLYGKPQEIQTYAAIAAKAALANEDAALAASYEEKHYNTIKDIWNKDI